jgi:hypothetical protein
MSKVMESLVRDAMEKVKTPEVQRAFQDNVVEPILTQILQVLYPYIAAVVGLWVLMFLGIVILLIRGKSTVGIQ